MPALSDPQIADLSLPSWVPFAAVQDSNLFIAAVGFEERSPACFERWCSAVSGRECEAILITYPSNKADNKTQFDRFISAANLAGVRVNLVEHDYASGYRAICSALASTSSQRILVDISTLASFAFYPLMHAICTVAGRSTLGICYAEASEYFPSRDEWDAFLVEVSAIDDPLERARRFDDRHFQSSGVDKVYEPAFFPGDNVDRLPTVLVVVPNFSFERVYQMINYTESQYKTNEDAIEWIIGKPPDDENNAWRHDALWDMFRRPSRRHTVSTFRYEEMLITLHELWAAKFGAEHMIIASLGSKSQHLGTLMFLLMHPEVGLVVSEPKQFNAKRYSERTGALWQTEFGKIDAFVEKLRSWNQLRFQWED